MRTSRPVPLDGEQAPVQALTDSAYGSGEARKDLADADREAVITPISLNPAEPGEFTLDDFTIKDNDKALTCRIGVTRRVTAGRAVVFGSAYRKCPQRARGARQQDLPDDEDLPVRGVAAGGPPPGSNAAVPTYVSAELADGGTVHRLAAARKRRGG